MATKRAFSCATSRLAINGDREIELLRRRLVREHAIRLAAEDIGERTTRQLDREVQSLTAANGQLEAARADLEALVDRLALPVLEVWPRIVAVPVVGGVTVRRAETLRAELGDAIRRRQPRVVIVDISGAGVIDTKSLSHLVALLQATRLLGCHAILTGLAPETAIAVPSSDVDLHGIATFGDTATAMAAAFGALGLTVSAGAP